MKRLEFLFHPGCDARFLRIFLLGASHLLWNIAKSKHKISGWMLEQGISGNLERKRNVSETFVFVFYITHCCLDRLVGWCGWDEGKRCFLQSCLMFGEKPFILYIQSYNLHGIISVAFSGHKMQKKSIKWFCKIFLQVNFTSVVWYLKSVHQISRRMSKTGISANQENRWRITKSKSGQIYNSRNTSTLK